KQVCRSSIQKQISSLITLQKMDYQMISFSVSSKTIMGSYGSVQEKEFHVLILKKRPSKIMELWMDYRATSLKKMLFVKPIQVHFTLEGIMDLMFFFPTILMKHYLMHHL